jgi:putative addiction module component (TIGR02574 family)
VQELLGHNDVSTTIKRGDLIMKKITATDVLELSIPERIQLVEDIWDTITAQATSVELTDDEKRIIDARLEKYHQNPELGSPWEDVYKRIVSRR